MPSGKLHLKRTPAEQAKRDLHKAQKAARKTARKRRHGDTDSSGNEQPRAGPSQRKRRHAERDAGPRKGSQDYPYVFYDSEDEYGPPPPPVPSSPHRAHKPDYDEILTQLEEERFREKMFGALEEDERLDGLESHLNQYAHIPRRWRGGGMDRMDDEVSIDPQIMEEEDYAEWVRAGMWRRKHAAEFAEQERKAAERAARKAREQTVKEETARLAQAEEEDHRWRRKMREHKRAAEAREWYDVRWKELLTASVARAQSLRFSDIPWPVLLPDPDAKRGGHVVLENLTVDAIAAFLVPGKEASSADAEVAKKRKEKLRETMLRFHPDKFEGRILPLVEADEQEKVREGVGSVARAINALMDIKER